MGRPTCSHCYGSHNIMSCQRLKDDYEVSKPIVDAWTEADDLKVRQGQYVRWYFQPIDREDLSKGYRHEEANEDGTIDSYAQSRLNDVELSIEISQKLRDEVSEFYGSSNISRHRNIVAKHEKVSAARARRAAKSCSWCKGEGHTVRTCPQRKNDAKTWENAVLLDSYYKAKAISEYGLWTAAMLSVPEDQGAEAGCYMFTTCNTRRIKREILVPWDIDTDGSPEDNEAISIQSRFLGAIAENVAFVHLKDLNSDSYSRTTLGGYDVTFDAEKSVFRLLRRAVTEEGTGCTFLPTKVKFEDIFSMLASRVSELPKKGFDKDTVATRIQVTTHWRSNKKHVQSHSCDLIEGVGVKKKERNTYAFEKLEAWVKSQEETLNKIRTELV